MSPCEFNRKAPLFARPRSGSAKWKDISNPSGSDLAAHICAVTDSEFKVNSRNETPCSISVPIAISVPISIPVTVSIPIAISVSVSVGRRPRDQHHIGPHPHMGQGHELAGWRIGYRAD